MPTPGGHKTRPYDLDETLDGEFNPLERIAQSKLAGEIHDGKAGFLVADIIVYDHGPPLLWVQARSLRLTRQT